MVLPFLILWELWGIVFKEEMKNKHITYNILCKKKVFNFRLSFEGYKGCFLKKGEFKKEKIKPIRMCLIFIL